MKATEFIFNRDDGTGLHTYLWTPDNEATQGIFFIIHGAMEHAKRYERFAEFLTAGGYIVCAADNRGHGLTAGSRDELGFLADSDGWTKVLEDIRAILQHLKKKYKGLEIILLGHSMGSFLARSFAIRCGTEIDRLILSGTAHNPKMLLLFARYLAARDIKKGKSKNRNPLLNRLAFKNLNKSFKGGPTGYEWLTCDSETVRKYAEDELCGFDFTSSALRDMFNGLLEITDRNNIRRMPKSLPILIISGDNDPVGGKGGMVRKCYRAFQSAGLTNVEMKLYKGMRHEILNEIGKEEVFSDILNWLK